MYIQRHVHGRAASTLNHWVTSPVLRSLNLRLLWQGQWHLVPHQYPSSWRAGLQTHSHSCAKGGSAHSWRQRKQDTNTQPTGPSAQDESGKAITVEQAKCQGKLCSKGLPVLRHLGQPRDMRPLSYWAAGGTGSNNMASLSGFFHLSKGVWSWIRDNQHR